jgi:hypothetical protein
MEEASKQFPQIWDPNNAIVGHLERIIKDNPWLYYVPQGFQRAVEIADMLTHRSSFYELQDENVKLRAELERYQRKSQPARGGSAAPRMGDKDFDEMTLDEQEVELRRITREADSYR